MFPHPGALFSNARKMTLLWHRRLVHIEESPQLFPTSTVIRGRLTKSGKTRTDRDFGSRVFTG
jgi:hypothetical protein